MKKMNDRKKIIEYIEKCKMYGVIKDKFIDDLVLHCYSKGEIIWNMSDDYKYLYFLVEGRILVHLNSYSGKEMYLDFGDPIEVLGYIEFINSSCVFSNVTAVNKCFLIGLPREIIGENAHKNPEFYELVSKYLGDTLIKTSKKYTSNILYSIKERIATYIDSLSWNEDEINLPRKKTALSLGVSERHLRRVLNDLVVEGAIEKEGRKIFIKDRKKLKEYGIKE